MSRSKEARKSRGAVGSGGGERTKAEGFGAGRQMGRSGPRAGWQGSRRSQSQAQQ